MSPGFIRDVCVLYYQIVRYSTSSVLTSSSDGQLALWRYDSSTPLCSLRLSSSDSYIHSIQLYADSILTASNSNRISVYTPDTYTGKFTSDPADKLKPDVFKGPLSIMSLLPMNRQLLLGSDNGTIQLMS